MRSEMRWAAEAADASAPGRGRFEGWRALTRRVLLNCALALASSITACGVGELIVRELAPQELIIKRPDVWKAVDTLGWVHQANLHTTINTGERTVHVVTDGEGFRVGRAGRPAARHHILLLGDSFMEALQVEYEQTLAGLLETRLPARLGAPVAVVNTGVGGWDPPQYLLQARALLRQRHYDLVLVSLYVGNDIVLTRPDRFPPRVPAEVHPFRVPRNLSRTELVDAVFYPINDFLEVRSQLFVFLKNKTKTLAMRLHLTGLYFPHEFYRSEVTSPRWQVTADICRDIAKLGERRGIRTLFFMIPTRYQVVPTVFAAYLRGFHIDSAQVDLDQPSRLLGEALRKQRLRVLDLLPVFRAATGQGEVIYGTVDPHLAPAGHDELERLLEPTVADLLAAREH